MNESRSVTSNGAFQFNQLLARGTAFTVSVATQPAGQMCQLTGGVGTVGTADYTDVTVVCTTTGTMADGGTPVGLLVRGTLAGLGNGSVRLTLNLMGAAANQVITLTENGLFEFPNAVTPGTFAFVTALVTATPAHVCQIDPTDFFINPNTPALEVRCSVRSFRVPGSLSGLSGGEVTIQYTDGVTQTLTSNGAFLRFLADGTAYDVSVIQQPTAPRQTCTVSNGAGTVAGADVPEAQGVRVQCVPAPYLSNGTVSGLRAPVTIQDSTGEQLVVTEDGPFSFQRTLLNGETWSFAVVTQPTQPNQTCVFTARGMGTVANDDTNAVLVCTTRQYSVFANVTGLAAPGLQFSVNGSVAADYQSPTTPLRQVDDGGMFEIVVAQQPVGPAQRCVAEPATGTIQGANITVAVTCTTLSFGVFADVQGLEGTGLQLRDGNGTIVDVSQPGAVLLRTTVQGATYDVQVVQQPFGPNQDCTVTDGAGTVGTADAVVAVQCVTLRYPLRLALSGLEGDFLQVRVDADGVQQTVDLLTNGNATALQDVPDGSRVTVSMLRAPQNPTQSCVVTPPALDVSGGEATVQVHCQSSNALLASLVVGGTLSPGFSPPGTSYAVDVETVDITVTAVAQSGLATVVLQGVSGSSPWTVPLVGGSNTVQVVVTSEDATQQRTYTLLVYRGRQSAALDGLSVTPGFLGAPFGPDVLAYDVTVPLAATTISITPSLLNPAATLTVDGVAATHDQPTLRPLTASFTWVRLVVTAEAGGASRTYVVRVHRGVRAPRFVHAMQGGDRVTSQAFTSERRFGSSSFSNLVDLGGEGSGLNSFVVHHPTARFLLTTDRAHQDLRVAPFDVDGFTTYQQVVRYPACSGRARGLAVSPDGTRVYADCGASILVWSMDGTTGALSALANNSIPASSSMALEPTGRFLIVTDTSGAAVRSYAIDTNGTLTPVNSQNLTAPLGNQLAVDPSGRCAVVTTSLGMEVYAIHPDTGALTLRSPYSVVGGAQGVAFHPSGSWVFAGSQAGGVLSLAFNGVTGTLTDTGFSTVEGGLGVLEVDPSGSLLMMTVGTESHGVRITAATGALTPQDVNTQSVTGFTGFAFEMNHL